MSSCNILFIKFNKLPKSFIKCHLGWIVTQHPEQSMHARPQFDKKFKYISVFLADKLEFLYYDCQVF